jgi:hypothetical protein
MSMLPFAAGPTISLLMYLSGVLSMLPLGAATLAEMDPSGPPVPSASPGPSMPGWLFGALTRPFSSRRCSRSTVTLPVPGTFPDSWRKASVASV